MLEAFQGSFGSVLLAILITLAAYSVVDAIYPQYASPIAIVTLMSVLFYRTKKG